ncbi:ABC-type polysaccharide/polyol phosphate export permease [Proteiniborus ethanoligenes]|uniref:Transport permease protein n=1 Tax=Proteiniborus ethanoligenes TaxID=415015 RepID=A0A1H3QJI5_9FIRM|nr:ABC transporter permease [Proteiniborus ethanoligenes]SDZ13774.1 ABC-type polysaccharide/polyol phosphate export permease [Proteiniborus ethanoligenes]
MEVFTVMWREFIFFKRRIGKITSTAIMTPILYLIAFGWGLGRDVIIEGSSYMHFIIPGIIALSTMNTSFNAVAMRINISKLHEKSFEYYLTSPVRMPLMALGHILSGALRGMYAATLIILVSYLFGIKINIDSYFILICFLNSFLFSAFGYGAALSIDSHYDMNRFTTYIMTPMSFLCGTFFSLNNLPLMIKKIISVLPLSHASISLRNIVLKGEFDYKSIIVLFTYSIIFYCFGVYMSFREMK